MRAGFEARPRISQVSTPQPDYVVEPCPQLGAGIAEDQSELWKG
jgi:hypothetical protein